ncbi:hypothetical protein DWF00_15595 [Bosea caraganae]|uniref:Sulfotransferase family protein n=1 Tax=Bosea caraganae TaxID=2763117 RepID=A0A370L6Z0_9HYPH|nr:hypothetical protein [Bosea caraganae]RDJ25403.1 hypothetical protein DWE98_11790 [Bosea caraganae]RDJ25812.1 hypothetical protein DWF00_15595 [Bosea caraganae]
MNDQTKRIRQRTRAAPAKHARDGFLVLGMHRSGTSAISGTLARLGATPPKTLMFGGADNPKGHWESNVITAMHDELLASAGSHWSDWRSFNADWYDTPIAGRFKEQAKTLLASEFGDAPIFVLKDPRICRFAGFWLDIFAEEDITPRLILPVRSPLEVARSLKARDGSPLSHGLLLWLRHALDAEAATREMTRAVLPWNAFLKDWQEQASQVALKLNIQWPRLTDLIAAEVDGFLTVELKHENVSNDEAQLHPEMHEWVMASYQALLELASNPESNSARATLDDIRIRFDDATRLFGRDLGSLEHQIKDLTDALSGERLAREQESQRHVNNLAEEQGTYQQKIVELETQFEAQQTQANETRHHLEETLREEAQKHALERQHLNELLASKVEALQEQHLAYDQLRVQHDTLVEEHAAHIAQHERERSELSCQIEEAKAQIDEAEARRINLEASFAEMQTHANLLQGKLDRLRTHPFRSVLRWLTGKDI